MSRTDQDKPWPLRAAEHQSGSYLRHLCGGYRLTACDVDADPYEVWKNAYNTTGRRRAVKAPECGWTFEYGALMHPPSWYVRHVWNGPERVRERAQLGEMVKEYNAAGEIEDDDFGCWQHRHMAHWLYW